MFGLQGSTRHRLALRMKFFSAVQHDSRPTFVSPSDSRCIATTQASPGQALMRMSVISICSV